MARNAARWDAILSAHGGILEHLILQKVLERDDNNLRMCDATEGRVYQLAGAFCFRRQGTSPSHFGVRSLARNESSARIVAKVKQKGRTLGYLGPPIMELKYDSGSKGCIYIEANPSLGLRN